VPGHYLGHYFSFFCKKNVDFSRFLKNNERKIWEKFEKFWKIAKNSAKNSGKFGKNAKKSGI